MKNEIGHDASYVEVGRVAIDNVQRRGRPERESLPERDARRRENTMTPARPAITSGAVFERSPLDGVEQWQLAVVEASPEHSLPEELLVQLPDAVALTSTCSFK
jgi:hypothetical protein